MDIMKNIVIFGCGGIGLRYAEGIAALEYDVNLYMVEPIESQVVKVSKIYEDARKEAGLKSKHTLHLNEILPDLIDILIVSTSSFVREEIVKEVLSKHTVKSMFLEKFLFPRYEAYDEILALIKDAGLKTYVSTWMHIPDAFQKLFNSSKIKDGCKITVRGDGYGLGCNAVHFINLLDHFSSKGKIEIVSSEVYELRQSKRAGYYEIDGQLTVMKSSIVMEIISDNNSPTGEIEFYVDGKLRGVFRFGEMVIIEEGASNKEIKYPVEMMAEIVKNEIISLIETGEAGLTPFNNSIRHHHLIFEAFSSELAKRGKGVGFDDNTLLFT